LRYRVLVRIGGEEMLSWGGVNPEQTLHALLQAVAVLLKPGAGDSASLGIGEVGLFYTALELQNCRLDAISMCDLSNFVHAL